jgi:hypothetical protein
MQSDRYLKTVLTVIAVSLLVAPLLGCARKLVAASATAGGPIKIPRDAPYYDWTMVPTSILNECPSLGTRLGASLQEFSAKYGVKTVFVEDVDPGAEGWVFQVQITNVYSRGNWFIGHRKSMAAKGELFLNGESQGIANFTRDSGGGFWGGFKGSCAVLARCSRTLGNDFAKWLDRRD